MAEFECPYCGKEYKSEYYFDKHVASCDKRVDEDQKPDKEVSEVGRSLNPVHPKEDAVAPDAPCYIA